jgi:chromatin modification-related protein VID21
MLSSASSPIHPFSEITRRRDDYLREMFALLQKRNSAELVLTTEYPHDHLAAFITRFDISKRCVWLHSFLYYHFAHYVLFRSQGAGSIAQLADSEFAPSPPHLRTPTPLTPDAYHDAPMAPLPDSPMSDALTPPSPLPPDVEMNPVAPEEDRSSDLGDLQLPSPDISLEHVDEPSLELELPDEEPPLPLVGDVDHSEDVPVDPSITSSECTPADTGADAGADKPQPEDIEEIVAPVTPMETDSDQLAAETPEESRSEALVSPSIVEDIYLQEDTDMDVDPVGESHIESDESITPVPERRSTAPPAPTASQTEVQPSASLSPVASAPVVALPPSAFILPPKTEVFIPVRLTPVGESPQYALDLASPEPRSLTVNEWLSPEFSLSREYTLPPVKSLPLDQQRRLKLGKNQRKKDKEKDRGAENRKDGTEDWTPLGINKWGVTITTNPLWKRVSRATKTMSTRDWNVSPSFYADYHRPQWRPGGF